MDLVSLKPSVVGAQWARLTLVTDVGKATFAGLWAAKKRSSLSGSAKGKKPTGQFQAVE